MKYLLILLLIPVMAAGQKDTLPSFRIDWGQLKISSIVFSNPNDAQLLISIPDSVLTIHGDTMEVIRMLVRVIKDKNEEIEKKEKLVSAAVNFSNNVSDYFKSKEGNCMWPAYLKELKRNGYHFTKTKNCQPCK